MAECLSVPDTPTGYALYAVIIQRPAGPVRLLSFASCPVYWSIISDVLLRVRANNVELYEEWFGRMMEQDTEINGCTKFIQVCGTSYFFMAACPPVRASSSRPSTCLLTFVTQRFHSLTACIPYHHRRL